MYTGYLRIPINKYLARIAKSFKCNLLILKDMQPLLRAQT